MKTKNKETDLNDILALTAILVMSIITLILPLIKRIENGYAVISLLFGITGCLFYTWALLDK
jgi:hypothetical protein